MKELIHKLKQISKGTRVIENRDKYKSLCLGCVAVHFFFCFSMFCTQMYPLAIYNLFVVIFYSIMAWVVTPREKYQLIFIATVVEIETNSVLCSIALGSYCQFMLYTLALIPGAFYLANTWSGKNKAGRRSDIPVLITVSIVFLYVIVDIIQTFVPPIYQGKYYSVMKGVYHYLNIGIATVLLLIFSVLFALEVRHIQKMLTDENSRLGEIASKDPLTKALNRRSMCNFINSETERNENAQFCIIMIDIDDFKKINDTYGHDTGDQVLVEAAEIMRQSVREGDFVCRWGGEEFLLMIHGSSEDTYEVAERIRNCIAEHDFLYESMKFHVTMTLGISEYQHGLQIRTLVDTADQKLYYGKKHGKNQVVR